ncbi:putative cytochrome c-type biogenesis protein CcmE [Fimbriimonas ginsengisoli Gsoil 348]|uniref:Putative cytochrome c-type biogenesis protein CcmE n=1 Tax=Fimbriimonas ginsengisoli Gsoil 348 TaxID=661478 RepID=A0A068NYS1_FIMGI|nr:putative cytochrome c-type biogenesis protein CcmE [Fimbriimonas ginsengisoli Gsoil 348]
MVAAFLRSASPYVTIAQAKTSSGDRLHLMGDLVKNSFHTDFKQGGSLTFLLKDPEGATVTVRHLGERPANMGEATQVVAIGGMQGSEFVSKELLLKCPSKYEGKRVRAPSPSDRCR